MGGTSYSSSAANYFAKTTSTKSTNQIFTQNTAHKVAATMSPDGLKFRESRDSVAHPESLAIAIFLDVTGSMGQIPEHLIKNNLPTLMDTIIKHGVEHPHVMFSAIGDIADDAPLQVGQYEAGDKELNECLSSVWLEGNGHGNQEEAYILAHLVAARHTSIDCFEKRGEKGILFTIGDEASHSKLSVAQLKHVMGYTECEEVTHEQLLAEAQRMYHIYHIHVEQGNYPSHSSQGKKIVDYWKNLLPERVILLNDSTELAEVIATTVAMIHGAAIEDIVKDFDKSTANNVTTALARINVDVQKNGRKQQEGVMVI